MINNMLPPETRIPIRALTNLVEFPLALLFWELAINALSHTCKTCARMPIIRTLPVFPKTTQINY